MVSQMLELSFNWLSHSLENTQPFIHKYESLNQDIFHEKGVKTKCHTTYDIKFRWWQKTIMHVYKQMQHITHHILFYVCLNLL